MRLRTGHKFSAKTSIRPVNRNIHQGRHRTERSRASHSELDVANTL